MPEYLKKVVGFFKSNQSAKDLLIGSVGAVMGGLSGWAINRLVKKHD